MSLLRLPASMLMNQQQGIVRIFHLRNKFLQYIYKVQSPSFILIIQNILISLSINPQIFPTLFSDSYAQHNSLYISEEAIQIQIASKYCLGEIYKYIFIN